MNLLPLALLPQPSLTETSASASSCGEQHCCPSPWLAHSLLRNTCQMPMCASAIAQAARTRRAGPCLRTEKPAAVIQRLTCSHSAAGGGPRAGRPAAGAPVRHPADAGGVVALGHDRDLRHHLHRQPQCAQLDGRGASLVGLGLHLSVMPPASMTLCYGWRPSFAIDSVV